LLVSESETVPLFGRYLTACRVGVVAVALLVLLKSLELLGGYGSGDSASYGAGYAAASNGAIVRSAMTSSRSSTSTVCEELLRQALNRINSGNVVRDEFLSGCRHAVADTME
jgi:hypothetical protein